MLRPCHQPSWLPKCYLHWTQRICKYQQWSYPKIIGFGNINYLSCNSCYNHLLQPSIVMPPYIQISWENHSLTSNQWSLGQLCSCKKNQGIFDQNYSLACGWALLWNIYRKCDLQLVGFNTYFDTEIANISIRPNEELAEFYSRTMTIQKNYDLSKAIISPNILIELYLILLIYCPTNSPFLAVKKIFVCYLPFNLWK